ncbi:MAG: potassium-transporting ATPase subunit KdpC [Actinomycetota bacterium]|nr:potassium-transporting ATPase subunit KdpC [Actinomycetota bacterium]
MRRQLLAAFKVTLVLTVLFGVAYPLAVTAVSQLVFSDTANGSLVQSKGKVVGSSLIGQNFTSDRYFQPRPSAAGKDGYDGLASSASNLGPSNPTLLDSVQKRADDYRKANGVPTDKPVPVDAVTASGSGLDPDISVANARLQVGRVAAARGLPLDTVLRAVDDHTSGRQFGILGERVVNVLELNLDLDRRG